MAVNVRSFIKPFKWVDGFELGKAFEVSMPFDSTLGQLVQKIFAGNSDTIGLMVVNGEVSYEKRRLSPGDRIDIYPLLEGG